MGVDPLLGRSNTGGNNGQTAWGVGIEQMSPVFRLRSVEGCRRGVRVCVHASGCRPFAATLPALSVFLEKQRMRFYVPQTDFHRHDGSFLPLTRYNSFWEASLREETVAKHGRVIIFLNQKRSPGAVGPVYLGPDGQHGTNLEGHIVFAQKTPTDLSRGM